MEAQAPTRQPLPTPHSGFGLSTPAPTQQLIATAPVQPGTLAGHPGLGLERLPDDTDVDYFQMRKLFPHLVLVSSLFSHLLFSKQ